MVAVVLCFASESSFASGFADESGFADATSIIAWPGGKERHYKGGWLHREGGPAVVIKGTYEAWYQRGDPHRIGAAAFTQAIARAREPERRRIVDTRCAYMVQKVYNKCLQTWVKVVGIGMIDSYVFTLERFKNDYHFWGYTGDVLGTDCRTSRVTHAYTQNMWDKFIPLDDLVGWHLTGLYLDCMTATAPIYFVRCKTCKEAFESLNANTLPAHTVVRKMYGDATEALCKLCAQHV